MEESSMSVTAIDLDDDALEKARPVAGGGTKKEVVNTAVREDAQRHEPAERVGNRPALS